MIKGDRLAALFVCLFRLCLTVNASVNVFLGIGELEYVGKLLLGCGDASGILADDNIP